MSRLDEALARIDAANAADPNRVATPEGEVGKELLYGRRMSEWLAKLDPNASEELQIACRAQHICRWQSPRSDYPEGRAGYKNWRSNLMKHHADLTGEILRELDYSSESIERVQSLIKKLFRTKDPESQTLEDAACMVFLQYEFDAFAAKHEDDKLIDIVQKTWKKMSESAHQHALTLAFSPRCKDLVTRALS